MLTYQKEDNKPKSMEKKWYFNLFIIIAVSVLLTFPDSTKAADFALSFDGIDDYVRIPHADILSPTEAITIESWFYPRSFGSGIAAIYSKGNGGYIYYYLYNDATYPNGIWAESWGLPTIGTNNVIELNRWYHVVATYDRVNFKLYLNGALISSAASSRPLQISEVESLIGGFPRYDGYEFDGFIDEVRVYSRALSAAEITEHYNKVFSDETDLVGLWHLNEGEGSVAYDSSGQGNNGSILGTSWTEGVGIEGGEISVYGEGVENAAPTMKLETELAGVYRDEIPISYSSSDPDEGIGDLAPYSTDVFYSDDGGYSWQKVAEKLANAGVYYFDSGQVADGTNYKLRVVVLDGYGSPGNADSGIFSVDNTGPTFDIVVSTPLVREKDTIEFQITSSEDLRVIPDMKITRAGAEPVAVQVEGEGREFSVSYNIGRGPGEAVISLVGQDLVGNVGRTITSGETFLVERFGPPSPTIETPANNQSLTDESISVTGTSQPNTEVVLTLNETTEFTTQPLVDGSFSFGNISLSRENRGYNTLKIIAFNREGEDSAEVLLNVKLNSPPEISMTTSFEGTISGEKAMTWTASDANGDELAFSVEYSNDGGDSWDFIVSDFSSSSYQIDTTQLADGSNYLFRVTADDGTEKVSHLSGEFTLKNNLPHIALDIPTNYFTNIKTPLFTGKVTGSEEEISSVDYSLDRGETWQAATASDGEFDSLIERIRISFDSPLAEGKYSILIRTTDTLNRSVRISRALTIDTTSPSPPLIELPLLDEALDDSTDTNLELAGLQTVFQGKAEAEATVELNLAGKTYQAVVNIEGEFEIRDATLGIHGPNKFSLLTSDLAGNTSQTTGTVMANNSPQVSILSPEKEKLLVNMAEINWETEDPDKDPMVSQLLYQREDEEWVSLAEDLTINTYRWQVAELESASYKIKIVASDGMSETEEILDVFVDSIVPQVTFKVWGPAVTLNNQPTFTGQASDDFSGIEYVEYSLNNVDWYKALIVKGYHTERATFRFRSHLLLEDGQHQVRVKATDRAGNMALAEPQDLIIDTTPPYIGSNLILFGNLALFPDETGVIKLFVDTPYKILFSVASDAKEVILGAEDKIFDLTFNKATSLWESGFNFGEPGDYPLKVAVQDEVGNLRTKETALKVVSPGIIYKGRKAPLEEAEATLFIFDKITNSWLVWDGKAFNQENPQETGESGEYGFLVPPGKYQMEVSKPGFETVKSDVLEAENNYLINKDILLEKEKGEGIFNRILDFFINIFK